MLDGATPDVGVDGHHESTDALALHRRDLGPYAIARRRIGEKAETAGSVLDKLADDGFPVAQMRKRYNHRPPVGQNGIEPSRVIDGGPPFSDDFVEHAELGIDTADIGPKPSACCFERVGVLREIGTQEPDRCEGPGVVNGVGAAPEYLAQAGPDTGYRRHRQRTHHPIQAKISQLRQTHLRYRTRLGEVVNGSHISNDSNTTDGESVGH